MPERRLQSVRDRRKLEGFRRGASTGAKDLLLFTPTLVTTGVSNDRYLVSFLAFKN